VTEVVKDNLVRLVIFSHFFAPSIGGVEKQVHSLAYGLARRKPLGGASNFEVTVITNTPGRDTDDPGDTFEVVRCPTFFQLWRLIQRADVVHLAGPTLLPLLISLLLRKPTVIEHHGYQSICPNGLLIHQPERSLCPGHFQAKRYAKCFRCLASEMSVTRSLKNILLMFPRYLLSKSVTANIAITEHVLQRHRLPSSQVIYYGVENQQVRGAVAPIAIGDPHKFRFAFVGRFVPEKGICVFLEAVNILNSEELDFDVLLIGDGPQRKEVDAIIDKWHLADHVHVTGYVAPGEAMTNALRGVGAVVVPSVWEEAAGFSAIEQMVDGRLVIASAIGGLAEVVGDAGLLFPAGDAAALASLMREVLLNPSLVEIVGARGRTRALKIFEIERMIRDHAALYSQLVELRT
jgi:glycosyltransferase involved in cell wall biosynthesis